jgi:hypothetical protein
MKLGLEFMLLEAVRNSYMLFPTVGINNVTYYKIYEVGRRFSAEAPLL